jgi:serine/threonine protein kinase
LLLRERYRAVRQIGQGGFGKTFLAVDQELLYIPTKCIDISIKPTLSLVKIKNVWLAKNVKITFLK